jgi:hypothetical protein
VPLLATSQTADQHPAGRLGPSLWLVGIATLRVLAVPVTFTTCLIAGTGAALVLPGTALADGHHAAGRPSEAHHPPSPGRRERRTAGVHSGVAALL